MNRPLVLGITGASGAAYAARLVQVLLSGGHELHVSISSSGRAVLRQELGVTVDLEQFDAEAFVRETTAALAAFYAPEAHASTKTPEPGPLRYHHHTDFFAPIASGSYRTAGMVICPCSGSTLGAVAHGTGSNLIQRAADVHLKERRPLVLVPRETPLSLIQLDNLRRVGEAGAIVLPAMPGWYHGVRSIGDLIDFVVARILDQLAIPHTLMRRWGEG